MGTLRVRGVDLQMFEKVQKKEVFWNLKSFSIVNGLMNGAN